MIEESKPAETGPKNGIAWAEGYKAASFAVTEQAESKKKKKMAFSIDMGQAEISKTTTLIDTGQAESSKQPIWDRQKR